MFVKLDNDIILDMSTGTCYKYSPGNANASSEITITFNGTQGDRYCGGKYARDLWNFLCNQAAKLGEEAKP